MNRMDAVAFAAELCQKNAINTDYVEECSRWLMNGTLSLAYKGLTNISLPGGIYPSIRTVDLSHNRLGKLTESLTAVFPSLEYIDISDNRLRDIPDLSKISDSLISLRAESNKLAEVPSTLRGMRVLRELRIGQQSVSELPFWINGMSSLKILGVRAARMPDMRSSNVEWMCIDTTYFHEEMLSTPKSRVVQFPLAREWCDRDLHRALHALSNSETHVGCEIFFGRGPYRSPITPRVRRMIDNNSLRNLSCDANASPFDVLVVKSSISSPIN